jgi:hypothetical protein
MPGGNGVERAAINLVVFGNCYCMGSANPHDAAKLNVASSLCELLEAKFAQDLQDFSSREDSQL